MRGVCIVYCNAHGNQEVRPLLLQVNGRLDDSKPFESYLLLASKSAFDCVELLQNRTRERSSFQLQSQNSSEDFCMHICVIFLIQKTKVSHMSTALLASGKLAGQSGTALLQHHPDKGHNQFIEVLQI